MTDRSRSTNTVWHRSKLKLVASLNYDAVDNSSKQYACTVQPALWWQLSIRFDNKFPSHLKKKKFKWFTDMIQLPSRLVASPNYDAVTNSSKKNILKYTKFPARIIFFIPMSCDKIIITIQFNYKFKRHFSAKTNFSLLFRLQVVYWT